MKVVLLKQLVLFLNIISLTTKAFYLYFFLGLLRKSRSKISCFLSFFCWFVAFGVIVFIALFEGLLLEFFVFWLILSFWPF